jgi:hypothetical protein
MILGISLVVLGIAFGGYFGFVWNQETLKATQRVYDKELFLAAVEITRLRAQVANLIGKE